MTVDMKVAQRLARKFHANIRLDFSAEELETTDARNKLNGRDVCATHDFCDANMTMAEAWEELLGDPFEGQTDYDIELWNTAWGLAKANGFNNEWKD